MELRLEQRPDEASKRLNSANIVPRRTAVKEVLTEDNRIDRVAFCQIHYNYPWKEVIFPDDVFMNYSTGPVQVAYIDRNNPRDLTLNMWSRVNAVVVCPCRCEKSLCPRQICNNFICVTYGHLPKKKYISYNGEEMQLNFLPLKFYSCYFVFVQKPESVDVVVKAPRKIFYRERCDGTCPNYKPKPEIVKVVDEEKKANRKIDFGGRTVLKHALTTKRLTAHVKDKHSAIGYKCDICSKDYSSKDILARHKKEYHSTTRFKCKLCGTVGKVERYMVQHVKNHNMVTDVKGAYEKVNGDETAAPVMNTARVDVIPPSTSASEMVTSPFSGVVAIPTSTSGMVAQPTSGTDAVPMVASTSSQVCSGSVFALSDRAFKNRLKTYIALNMTNHESELKDILECVSEYSALKFNIFVECMFASVHNETIFHNFKSKHDVLYQYSDIREFINKQKEKILKEFEECSMKGSALFYVKLHKLELRVNKYTPLMGGSAYIELPRRYKNSKSLVNIVNSDIYCFKYCILSKYVDRDKNFTFSYENRPDLECKYDWCIDFPVGINDIAKFEKRNISINVFSLDENDDVFPLRMCEKELPDHRDLLYISNENISHYCCITNFSALVKPQLTAAVGCQIAVCKRCFAYFRHNEVRSCAERLKDHESVCSQLSAVRSVFPYKDYLSFDRPEFSQKGVFPYDYLTTLDRLEDNYCLPPKENFFSKLTNEHITEEDYAHAKSVWETFNIQTLGEYSDLYLKSDTLILTDVFENFREMCLKAYDLDFMYYYTVPGLAYSAMLKLTGVELQLIKDMTMLLLFEQGIRGGICQCVTRHAIANDPKSENFDDSKPPSAIYYVDANNLYGFAMSKKLPYGGFAWLTDEQIHHFDLQAVNDDSEIGYVPEVDIENANNDFEKDFFKLMNNAVFGKTIENVRKRTHFGLVSNDEKLKKLISKPYFLDRVIYAENLVGIHLRQTQILFDKALYVGMCILELSKVHMYNFHHRIMKEQFGDKFKLCYMDTDSFIYLAQTDDLYHDLQNVRDHLDTSVYSPNHILYSLQNKGVLGKFKDEIPNSHIDEFVGLNAKVYSLKCSDFEIKKLKGIKKSVIRNEITFADYASCRESGIPTYSRNNSIRSYFHNVFTMCVNKVTLNSFEDKRVILQDGVNTVPHGYDEPPCKRRRVQECV
ncbi:hypothetical protein ANN_09478 [Periplaneta americana]|uniref:C2H2-type domain-containing protein n=1 Tax=Periplaneta americana TaxID=6978 RepID=A0ABQ8TMY1_PERAM|nr:hypothetical protein ANN_09478 [Periplaneta americana]